LYSSNLLSLLFPSILRNKMKECKEKEEKLWNVRRGGEQEAGSREQGANPSGPA
jgi:hypothetical protein